MLVLQAFSEFAGKVSLYVAFLYVCPLVKEFLSLADA